MVRLGWPRWGPCSEALELLDSDGGPFDLSAYRRSWTESFPGWRDVSYGGQMRNGTRAAVSLLQWGRLAESMPNNYGTILATRQLLEHEVRSFLEEARISCGAHRLIARSVPLRPTPLTCHVGARIAGWTSVVYLEKGGVLEQRFAQKARRSIRKALRAGAETVTTSDPDGFLPLYQAASTRHWMQYPEGLIRALARAGVARFFDVRLGPDCVASVIVLTSSTHWVAWLAAQNQRGRAIDANYFAVGAMLVAAQRARVAGVNLGISLGMPGVARFKRRFDAVEVPVVEYRVMPWVERARVRTKIFTHLGLRRARRLVRRG
jgi:hypothetical protein